MKRFVIGIMIVVGLFLYSGYAYLCFTAPVNPDIALEYKTLLVNEVLRDSNYLVVHGFVDPFMVLEERK